MTGSSIGLLAGLALGITTAAFAQPVRFAARTASSAARADAALVPASTQGAGDDTHFPAGPGADLLDANCTTCHAASVVLSQAPRKPEQWQATVAKMRELYQAPVADRDVPAILGYLSALSARRAAVAAPR